MARSEAILVAVSVTRAKGDSIARPLSPEPMAPPSPTRSPLRSLLATGLGLHVLAWVASLLLHLGGALPLINYSRFAHLYDLSGEDGEEEGPIGNGGGELTAIATPVNVSVYTEPKVAAPAPTPTPAAPAASDSPAPAPVKPAADGTDASAASGEPSTEMANAREARIAEQRTLKEGQAGAPPRGKKKPCEQIEEVVALGEQKWRVERSLLDWYATHLGELERQVGVSSYRDEDGKRGGAKLYLPRCSVLRQGGMRTGDIVRTVNGRKVNTIAQGVATWLAVRNQKTITVELTRKDGQDLVHTYLMK